MKKMIVELKTEAQENQILHLLREQGYLTEIKKPDDFPCLLVVEEKALRLLPENKRFSNSIPIQKYDYISFEVAEERLKVEKVKLIIKALPEHQRMRLMEQLRENTDLHGQAQTHTDGGLEDDVSRAEEILQALAPIKQEIANRHPYPGIDENGGLLEDHTLSDDFHLEITLTVKEARAILALESKRVDEMSSTRGHMQIAYERLNQLPKYGSRHDAEHHELEFKNQIHALLFPNDGRGNDIWGLAEKYKDDPERREVIAGALCAALIDRRRYMEFMDTDKLDKSDGVVK
jgi:hypothetical protein